MGIRVVITGGGTGGHLYPALAVADWLKASPDVSDLLYIGNVGKKEAELVPATGLSFEGLTFSGMPRKNPLALFPWGFSLASAVLKARGILQRFEPQVVFATGGYVTAPVLLAAKSLGIPYVVHEPDAHPGLVNRTFAPYAAAVTCAFEAARGRLKTRALHVTGNPLRRDIGQLDRATAIARLGLDWPEDARVLLVTGGSQGARRINQGLLAALPQLLETFGLYVIHQTGETLYDEVQATCPEAYRQHPAYVCQPFITDMAATLALAHVAICRSGSMSLSEMYRAHVPTILVPYPFAAADHQRSNAMASQAAGASVMIEDEAFDGERLVGVLGDLLAKPETLAAMREAAVALARPHATDEVGRLIVAQARSGGAA